MTNAKQSALSLQEGGTHYKDLKIQPVEFIHANNIGFCEATAIKYLCRWRKKGGIQDLKKAKHFIDVLIELETRGQDMGLSRDKEGELRGFPAYDRDLVRQLEREIELEGNNKFVGTPIASGPYCNSCEQNLADFRQDNGKYLAPRYWCSNCAAEAGKDTSEMTLMGGM